MAKKQDRGPAIVPVRKVKEGTVLICAGGFSCQPVGAQRTVFFDRSKSRTMAGVRWNSRSRLYIHCAHGRHYLDGLIDRDGKNYVGFWLKKAPQK